MTSTDSEAPISAAAEPAAPAAAPAPKANRMQTAQPVLEQLFALYPQLFGANFLPLKRGIFQELLAAHPDHFDRDALKAALAVHTRSTRYLQCVAAGKQRHDLQGTPVEDMAPEHICQALLEVFRRRQARSKDDLRPRLRTQLVAAFEASGLSRQDYLERVQTTNAEANTLLAEAFAQLDVQLAKQEALARAFESSGKTPEEFADMYGMDLRDVKRALARKTAAPAPAESV
jgi:ProP effector